MATVRGLWMRGGMVVGAAVASMGCTFALDFDRTDLSVPDGAAMPTDAARPDVEAGDGAVRDGASDGAVDARACVCGDHQVCVANACQCETDFADCNGRANDGCEVDLTESGSNCGRCGSRCESGLVCRSGLCGCEGNRQLCGGACVDTQASTSNCGGCGVSCGSLRCCSGVCLARCGG